MQASRQLVEGEDPHSALRTGVGKEYTMSIALGNWRATYYSMALRCTIIFGLAISDWQGFFKTNT